MEKQSSDRSRRREGGGIKRYLHMEIPEKNGGAEGEGGWKDGRMDGSLTDLLPKTQGGPR